KRDVVFELLDADISLNVPGRHRVWLLTKACALFNRPSPWPNVVVGEQGHWCYRPRSMAILAAPLQNWGDVLGERHRLGLTRACLPPRLRRECTKYEGHTKRHSWPPHQFPASHVISPFHWEQTTPLLPANFSRFGPYLLFGNETESFG